MEQSDKVERCSHPGGVRVTEKVVERGSHDGAEKVVEHGSHTRTERPGSQWRPKGLGGSGGQLGMRIGIEGRSRARSLERRCVYIHGG